MAKKILIIDDEQKDLKVMKSLLGKEGYDVFCVSDGVKALDQLESHKFDLILIDIKMPTLSGYDLARLLREKLDYKVPMIYVTIVPKQEVDTNSVEGFVQKPFDNETFIKEVNRVLS